MKFVKHTHWIEQGPHFLLWNLTNSKEVSNKEETQPKVPDNLVMENLEIWKCHQQIQILQECACVVV